MTKKDFDQLKEDLDDPVTRALVDSSHPIWKVLLLCLLILGGGVVGSDTDIIGVAGL